MGHVWRTISARCAISSCSISLTLPCLLQSWEKTVNCYSPGQRLMPSSFKVRTVTLNENKSEEVLDPDFGESAIGRVAPVDSG